MRNSSRITYRQVESKFGTSGLIFDTAIQTFFFVSCRIYETCTIFCSVVNRSNRTRPLGPRLYGGVNSL